MRWMVAPTHMCPQSPNARICTGQGGLEQAYLELVEPCNGRAYCDVFKEMVAGKFAKTVKQVHKQPPREGPPQLQGQSVSQKVDSQPPGGCFSRLFSAGVTVTLEQDWSS